MAQKAGAIYVEMGMNIARMQKDISKIQGNINRFSKKASRDFSQTWQGMAVGIASVMHIAKQVGNVFKGIDRQVGELIDAAKKQEDAEVKLAAALKAAGEYTDDLNVKYQKYASWVQTVTTYGDEQVLTLMALTKNLGVSSDKVEEATKMAIGLAAATGRDARSMAQYVALAMQGEFTMLRRYIPALRATTDKTEQLRIVTEFAARGFQVAQEDTKSFGGRLKQFANLWGDLKERVGDAIIKNKAIIKLLEDGKKTLTSWIDYVEKWVKANGDLIAQKTEEAIEKIKKGLKDALPILETTAKAFVPIAKVIIRLFEAYVNLGRGIGETAAKIVLHFEKTKGATVDEANAMFSLEEEAKHLNREYRTLIERTIALIDPTVKLKEEGKALQKTMAEPFDWEQWIMPYEKVIANSKKQQEAIKQLNIDIDAQTLSWKDLELEVARAEKQIIKSQKAMQFGCYKRQE